MITIGVTGGIGSGKSVVCSLFSKKGIPVFVADDVAKEIPEKIFDLLKKIGQEFGQDTVDLRSRKIVAPKLAEVVFAEHEKLSRLNSLIHPYVFKEFESWIKSQRNVPYSIVEAALLYETKMDKLVDYSLLVMADDDLRMKRTQSRSNLTMEQVRSRMENQLEPETAMAKADFIVHNNGTTDELSSKIDFFHNLFINLTPKQ